ncbi:MAG: alpha/beta hydrolase [Desulfobacterales bacterium]|nr:alpha/beta hydrolase [Desulfobacterales bacterium]
MHESISFFWGGGEINRTLRSNFKAWESHLRQSRSNFKVVLWLDESAFGHLLENHLSAIKEVRGPLFQYTWSIQGCSVGINLFDPNHLFGHFVHLRQAYDILEKYRAYALLSDIARMAILSRSPGFYLDCDFRPNLKKPFVKSCRDVDLMLKGPCSESFYMAAFSNTLMESGMLFSSDTRSGARVLASMEDLAQSSLPQLESHAAAMRRFFSSPQNRDISRSMFSGGKYKGQLEAFKKGNVGDFRWATASTFGGMEDMFMPRFGGSPKKVGVFSAAGMPRWSVVLGQFFSAITDYFFASCKDRSLFTSLCQQKIMPLFDTDQSAMPLYSWMDPGYSRLLELKAAVATVEAFRLKKRNAPKPKPKASASPPPPLPPRTYAAKAAPPEELPPPVPTRSSSRQNPFSWRYAGGVFPVGQTSDSCAILAGGDWGNLWPAYANPALGAMTNGSFTSETFEVSIAEDGGARVMGTYHHRVGGMNPLQRVVILCSGEGAPSEKLMPAIISGFLDPELRDQIYGVVSFDYRGIGMSRDPQGGMGRRYRPKGSYVPTTGRLYTDTMAVIEYMSANQQIACEQMIVYGYGVGSGPATEMAVQYDGRVAGLMLHDPIQTLQVDLKWDPRQFMVPLGFSASDPSKSAYRNIEKMPLLKVPAVCIAWSDISDRQRHQASALCQEVRSGMAAKSSGVKHLEEIPLAGQDPGALFRYLYCEYPNRAQHRQSMGAFVRFCGRPRPKPRVRKT